MRAAVWPPQLCTCPRRTAQRRLLAETASKNTQHAQPLGTRAASRHNVSRLCAPPRRMRARWRAPRERLMRPCSPRSATSSALFNRPRAPPRAARLLNQPSTPPPQPSSPPPPHSRVPLRFVPLPAFLTPRPPCSRFRRRGCAPALCSPLPLAPLLNTPFSSAPPTSRKSLSTALAPCIDPTHARTAFRSTRECVN